MRSILSRDVLKYLRKKRRKEILIQTETVSLPDIPEEVLIEILIRLPVKSLLRFKCVSKLWLSLTSSHYFSNRRPLRFFAYLADQDNPGNYAWFTSSSVSVMSQDVTVPRTKGYFLSAARGLVCIRSGTTVQICNIHTRQLVQLPSLRSQMIRDNNVRCYLGYNPVHDEYKVLSVAWKVESYTLTRSKHQVLILGAGASWRKIQCNVPHRAFLMGITINGVLYYGASTRTLRCVLVSFDLTSEEFTLTEFPNTGTWHWYLSCTNIVMNYQGKVALLDYSKGVTVNLWVLEDAEKSQWSDKKTFALPLSQMNFIIPETQKLKMGSTSRSGQVWLTMEGRRKKYQPTRFCFLIYDLERNEIMQRIEMGPLPSSSKWSLSTFWDDTENLMYLET